MSYVDLKSSNTNGRKNKARAKKYFFVFLGVFAVAGVALFLGGGAFGLFDPVSIVGGVAAADLKETDGRTNVLVLGSDKRSLGVSTSELTDTILVASIGKYDENVVLISLPRDLWVKSPSGIHSKINAVYSNEGAEVMMEVVEDVLGIPIHYYSLIDFYLFKEVVDILGGVEVDVEKAFDDFYYPVEGKENAPEEERYETVHFDAGVQTMDGEAALKYARSRKGTNGEGTDFARSKRQQKVIMAIKNKALSFSTLTNLEKVKELYDSYSTNVDSNLDFNAIKGFFILSQQIDFDAFRTIVLDDRSMADAGGLLFAPEDRSLYGGAYVLIPRVGDFSQLHAYVQRYIFGD